MMDLHGNLTLCGLFIARLCFAAVLAVPLGCLTEGERAEPLSPRSPQCSQGSPEHRVTWRGNNSCLLRLCEHSAVLQCLEASRTGRNTNHFWEKQGDASAPHPTASPLPRLQPSIPKKQPHSIPSACQILHFARPWGGFGPSPLQWHIRANPTGIHSSAASTPRLGLHPISLVLR